MRFVIFAAVLLSAFACTPAGDAKKGESPKKEEKKDDQNTPPEKQFADLEKQFKDAISKMRVDMQAAKTDEERKKVEAAFQADHEKLAGQFFALGKANLKAEFAFAALMIAIQNRTTDAEAIKAVVENFGDDPRILQLVPMLMGRADGEKTLAQIAESKNIEVRGGVRFLQLTGSLEQAELDPNMKEDDRRKVFAEAPNKLEELVKEYGDVKVMTQEGPVQLSVAAKGVAYLLENLIIGRTLADVDCPTLDSNKSAKISEYRGKVVVLDIWATWCPPCRAMIPHEREMVKKLAGKPFALISVSADDKKETLTKFLEKNEMPWTHWHAGANGEILKKYQVKFFPTIYVLDTKGVIRYKNVRDQELEHAVEELLKEAEKAEKK